VNEPRQLDITKPQKVSYMISTELRDEQIRLNIASVAGRLSTDFELRDEPIAIVCFGPSLQDTWEEVRKFKHVMSCSGAHPFLIERGIIPNWHVAVDPLPGNTVRLIGTPHKDVEYLIASACHPDVFKHLEGFNVKMWHVFDPSDEGIRLLPPGEWALTGGCDVGMRSMSLARFLGFRELHIFGRDGNYRSAEKQSGHAGSHPGQATPVCEVEYGGKKFRTTPAFAEAARQMKHELDALADVKATFYGEGLVQAMMKDYVRSAPAPGTQILAVNKPTLISESFRELNAQLHRERPDYGMGGARHAGTVTKLVESLRKDLAKGSPSVLDYGCGKGLLARTLPFPIWEYDPAIPEKSGTPRPADLVVCTDVLEHVEPEKLMWVLADLRRCTSVVGYFVIHTGAAKKTYPDGRNTHLIQRDLKWWKKQLAKLFEIRYAQAMGKEIHAVVSPLPKAKIFVPEATVETR
jgi:hypothetical protein